MEAGNLALGTRRSEQSPRMGDMGTDCSPPQILGHKNLATESQLIDAMKLAINVSGQSHRRIAVQAPTGSN